MFGHPCGVSEWAERAFVREGEGGRAPGVGKWAGVQGWPAPRTEASRAGFGQAFRCLDAEVNFLQRFQLATWDQLATQPGVGLVGILLGPGV